MVHRVNGAVFIAVFLVLSGLCVKVVIDTGTDLGPRAALHSLTAVACFALLAFKVAVVQRYRGFYAKLPSAGLWLSALTFLLIFSSAGYFFLVSDLAGEGGARSRRPWPESRPRRRWAAWPKVRSSSGLSAPPATTPKARRSSPDRDLKAC